MVASYHTTHLSIRLQLLFPLFFHFRPVFFFKPPFNDFILSFLSDTSTTPFTRSWTSPCVSSAPITCPGEVGHKKKKKKRGRKEKDLNCLGNSTRFEWHAAFIPLGPRAFAHDASLQAHCGHSSLCELQTGRSWTISQPDSCLLGLEGQLYCGLRASYCWVWDMLAQRPYSCTVGLRRLTQQQVGPLWAPALDLLLYFWGRCSPLACVKMYGHNGTVSALNWVQNVLAKVSDWKMNWLDCWSSVGLVVIPFWGAFFSHRHAQGGADDHIWSQYRITKELSISGQMIHSLQIIGLTAIYYIVHRWRTGLYILNVAVFSLGVFKPD